MRAEKSVAQELTDEQYRQLVEETAKETGYEIPTVSRVVYFVLGETARLIRAEEKVEIKFDYMGKIRYKGDTKKKMKHGKSA